jgi:hypothetical protein
MNNIRQASPACLMGDHSFARREPEASIGWQIAPPRSSGGQAATSKGWNRCAVLDARSRRDDSGEVVHRSKRRLQPEFGEIDA